MTSNRRIAVYGAYGHTGCFVVAELQNRGWMPMLSGRDAEKLDALAAESGGLEIRPAAVEDAESLDRALDGAVAVINCAGPFAVTSAPIIEATLRAKIPYLDVAAEVEVAAAAFEQFQKTGARRENPDRSINGVLRRFGRFASDGGDGRLAVGGRNQSGFCARQLEADRRNAPYNPDFQTAQKQSETRFFKRTNGTSQR